jgi:N-dimethylarginine dimethylaminohydrolase
MNMLSIDENTVVIDAAQGQLIKDLERCEINCIPLTLRHSRTLGGSFHCVTLDLVRE